MVISDNGPQYSSHKFAEFASSYKFCHITSSPHYLQSNGQAERAVQIVKKLLKSLDDPHWALLTYCTTPLPWCNLSPAQLLMGRSLRTILPQAEDQYKPHWQYLESFKELNAKFKLKQKTAYDRRHRAHSLSPIPEEEEVWVTSGQSTTSGQVRSQADTPRSYIVNTPQGPIRRNCCHLRVVPNSSNTNAVQQDGTNPLGTVNPTMEDTQQDSCNPSRTVTRSMTGTAIRPPDRLRF